jgi:hypothetical protein
MKVKPETRTDARTSGIHIQKWALGNHAANAQIPQINLLR